MARPEKRRIEGGTTSAADADTTATTETGDKDGATEAKPAKAAKTTKGPKPTVASGRTTAKGTPPKGSGNAPAASSRYTPPNPATLYTPSPIWVPILMFSLFGAGLLCIFLNYTGTLPSSPSGWYLLGGLGAILAGIITSTQLR